MRKLLFESIALALFAYTLQAQQQPPPITIAIRAGKLIDVTHSRLLTNQIILIRENGTIAAVGANVAIPANAQTIDLSTPPSSPASSTATPTSPTARTPATSTRATSSCTPPPKSPSSPSPTRA